MWKPMPAAVGDGRPFDGELVLIVVLRILGSQFGGGVDPSSPRSFYLARWAHGIEQWVTTETDEETGRALLIGFHRSHLWAEVD